MKLYKFSICHFRSRNGIGPYGWILRTVIKQVFLHYHKGMQTGFQSVWIVIIMLCTKVKRFQNDCNDYCANKAMYTCNYQSNVLFLWKWSKSYLKLGNEMHIIWTHFHKMYFNVKKTYFICIIHDVKIMNVNSTLTDDKLSWSNVLFAAWLIENARSREGFCEDWSGKNKTWLNHHECQ